ncbi:MAG: glucokinase [Pseudomonadota bacterium]
MPTAPSYAVVADVGGTNTRVALAEGPNILPSSVRRFRNDEHPDLEQILRAFVAGAGNVVCHAVCAAIAGPVRDGQGNLTNLDWSIDGASISAATGATRAAILNDLQAQGYALGHIDNANIRPILGRTKAPRPGPQLVVGVGTGFNATPVYNTPAGKLVAASESGHVTLPTQSTAEERLSAFIARSHGFAAVEEVISGRGLEHIYAWQAEEAGSDHRLSAAEIMAQTDTDELAAESVATFVRVLGAVVGNLALTFLPFGGIYLVGGVARSFAPRLSELGFGESFRAKGRFAAFMEDFSVAVIEDDFAALSGCAAHLADIPKI